MNKIRLAANGILRLPFWFSYALATRRSSENEAHARAATNWLIECANQVKGRGFAHSLHFARGWLPAYPETTGYIVPTLMVVARKYGWEDAERTALNAWKWLSDLQETDGAFSDLAGTRQVFDSGQILIGANYLTSAKDARSDVVARKCVDWLIQQQSEDGCFIAHAYNGRPHAYYSRVGAALLEAGQLLDLESARVAGLRNLEWTLNQQRANGWFDHMSFSHHPPFSHTIVYTLEGLLAGYRLSGDTRVFDAVVRCSTALRDSITRHAGVIRSQYHENFAAVDEQICVTGLCQWAAHCFRLDRLGVTGFAEEAEKSLHAAKLLQLQSSLSALDGALPGSVPLSGRYMRYALPNWGVKFFLDALLEADGGIDMPALI